jgi:predicted ATP-grasp superfamily ATP-dependent carboligase
MSKYANSRRQYPDPVQNAAVFLSWLEEELTTGCYDMVLPVAESTVRIVTENQARFEPHAVVPFLPHEQLLVGLDKAQTIRAARAASIPHPKTLFLEEPAYDRTVQELGTPIVVKARQGSSRSGVYVCSDRLEYETAFETARTDSGPPLVQEYVPNGGERGVYVVYGCDGSLLGQTVQRRLRSSHDDGGASTYRETVDDPELCRVAERLLEQQEWRGVAMVEFRIDARTGEAKLMEVNPRLWGSLALTVRAGVDVPYLLYRTACFGDAEPVRGYQTGVRMRWLLGDVARVARSGDRFGAIQAFVVDTASTTGYDVLAFDDRLPAIGQVEMAGRGFLSQIGRRLPVAIRGRRPETKLR